MAFMTNYNQPAFAATSDHDTAVYDQFGHSASINTKHYGHNSGTPHDMSIKTFIAHAHVSATFHLLYGHPPTLLERLESPQPRIDRILATIANIRHPPPAHPSFDNSTLAISRPPSKFTDPAFFIKVQQIVEMAVAKSHAAVVNLFGDRTTIHPISTLPPAPPVVAHPYIINKLRDLYPEFSWNLAFTNPQQAQVTQLLFKGDRHVAYVSPTGQLKFNIMYDILISFDA